MRENFSYFQFNLLTDFVLLNSSPAEEQILNQQKLQEEREVRAMVEKEERAKLRMSQVMEKAKTLRSKLLLLEDPRKFMILKCVRS